MINLKIIDINGKQNVVTVKNGKGQKDRTIMLSEKLKLQLHEYYKKYKPKTFLFEGQKGDAYTQSSLQSVIKQASKRCNILKTVTAHTFIYSFAKHLLEQDVDIRIIQKLLGHKNIKITQIYTQVSSTLISQVISSLDTL